MDRFGGEGIWGFFEIYFVVFGVNKVSVMMRISLLDGWGLRMFGFAWGGYSCGLCGRGGGL